MHGNHWKSGWGEVSFSKLKYIPVNKDDFSVPLSLMKVELSPSQVGFKWFSSHPLVFTQVECTSRRSTHTVPILSTHFTFEGRLVEQGFSRVLETQDTSHQNKKCCNNRKVHRIPRKYCRIGCWYSQNYVVMRIRQKSQTILLAFIKVLKNQRKSWRVLARGGMVYCHLKSYRLPVITRTRILEDRKIWISRQGHEL